MPIDRPLPYEKVRRFTKAASSNLSYGNCYNWKNTHMAPAVNNGCGDWDANASVNSYFAPAREWIIANNAAIESFRGSISDQAELMVNALQYRQAGDMLAKGLTTVVQFARAVKRGNLREIERIVKWRTRLAELRSKAPEGVDWAAQTGNYARRLESSTDKKRFRPLPASRHARNLRKKDKAGYLEETRDLGNAWLTYSYGLKPIIQDIYTSLDILTKDDHHLLTPHEGKGRCAINRFGNYTYTTDTPVYWRNVGEVIARCGGIVRVTNPNHMKLSALGLTNPLTWAYELVPWSFVLDWFVNVGDVLASMSPQLGYEVINPWSMTKVVGTLTADCSYKNGAAWPPELRNQSASIRRELLVVQRLTSLPAVKLARRTSVITSLSRALNAASLLAVRLRPNGPRTMIA